MWYTLTILLSTLAVGCRPLGNTEIRERGCSLHEVGVRPIQIIQAHLYFTKEPRPGPVNELVYNEVLHSLFFSEALPAAITVNRRSGDTLKGIAEESFIFRTDSTGLIVERRVVRSERLMEQSTLTSEDTSLVERSCVFSYARPHDSTEWEDCRTRRYRIFCRDGEVGVDVPSANGPMEVSLIRLNDSTYAVIDNYYHAGTWIYTLHDGQLLTDHYRSDEAATSVRSGRMPEVGPLIDQWLEEDGIHQRVNWSQTGELLWADETQVFRRNSP